MNSKTIMVLAVSLIMITSALYVFTTTDPLDQTVSVHVVNEIGNPVKNASVQGMILRPKSYGGGFATVFKGETNSNGVFSTTDVSGIQNVLSMWKNVLGPNAKVSSPDILVFVTYGSSNGIYFRQSSISLPKDSTLYSSISSGSSLSTTVALPLNSEPSMSYSGLPTPPGGGGYIWEQVNCVSTGTIQIPVSWITTGSCSVGTVGTFLLNSQTTSWNVGLALGTGSDGIQTSGGFQSGGTIWSSTVDFGAWSKTVSNGGSAYVYMCAQAAGALFQMYTYNPYMCARFGIDCPKPTDHYQYDTGIINPSINNGWIVGNRALGNPPYISEIDKNFSYDSYCQVTGTGNFQNPHYPVYSNQFVDTYAASDTQWISVGVDVGAILSVVLDVTEPEIGIPLTLLLSIVGSISSSSSSNALSSAYFDGGSGYTVFLNVMVGNVQYSLSNGQTGEIPLFGVQVYSIMMGY